MSDNWEDDLVGRPFPGGDDDNPLQQYNHDYHPMQAYPDGWVDDPDSASGKGVFKFWEDDEFDPPNAWVEPSIDANQWEWGYNHPTIPALYGEGVANSREEAIAAAEEHRQHSLNKPGNYEYNPISYDGWVNTSSRSVPNFVRTSAPRLPIEYQYDRYAGYDRIQALRNGKPVGSLYMNGSEGGLGPRGMINDIFVNKSLRGRGIGRGMVEHAIQNGLQPIHSDALLKDGRDFANAVPLPRAWRNSDGYKIVPWEHGEPGGGDPNAYRIPVDDTTWRFDGQKYRQDFDAAPEWKPGIGAALYPKSLKHAKVNKTAVRWDGSLGDLTFQHKALGSAGGTYHLINAYLNGQRVGVTRIADPYNSRGHEPGEIQMISVDEPFRNNGIARAMVEHAASLGIEPRHSGALTPDGVGFAEATPEFGNPWAAYA